MFNHAQSEVICPRLVQRIVETRCALTRTAIEAMHGLVSDQGLDESLSAWACRNIPRGTCPSLQVRVSRTFDGECRGRIKRFFGLGNSTAARDKILASPAARGGAELENLTIFLSLNFRRLPRACYPILKPRIHHRWVLKRNLAGVCVSKPFLSST